MRLVPSLFLVALFANLGSSASVEHKALKACQLLKEKFSGLVSFPGKMSDVLCTGLLTNDLTFSLSGTQQFANDAAHWAISSQQNATCSIEPEDADDVSAVVSR